MHFADIPRCSAGGEDGIAADVGKCLLNYEELRLFDHRVHSRAIAQVA